jgi:hypothetical protein
VGKCASSECCRHPFPFEEGAQRATPLTYCCRLPISTASSCQMRSRRIRAKTKRRKATVVMLAGGKKGMTPKATGAIGWPPAGVRRSRCSFFAGVRLLLSALQRRSTPGRGRWTDGRRALPHQARCGTEDPMEKEKTVMVCRERCLLEGQAIRQTKACTSCLSSAYTFGHVISLMAAETAERRQR